MSGTCNKFSVRADELHNGRSTYTYFAVSRVRNVSTPTPSGGNPTETVPPPNPPFYTFRILGDDLIHDINYLPIQQNLSVNLVRHYHASFRARNAGETVAAYNAAKASYDGDATQWPTYSYAADAPYQNGTIPCFSASCSIDVTGDGPGGVIIAGGTQHVRITINNTGPQPLPNPYPGPYYLGVVVNSASWYNLDPAVYGGLWPPGSGGLETGYLYFDSPAGTTITAYPAFLGHFGLGGNCAGSGTPIQTYTGFTLTAMADSPGGTVEYPGPTINYRTGAKNSINTPVTVYADSNGTANGVTTGPTYNGNVNNITTTEVTALNNTLGTPANLKAGDSFCSYITLQHWSGLVSSTGAVIWQDDPGLVGNRQASTCMRVVNEPYFRATGAAVSAGGNFEGLSSCAGGGTLASWLENTSGQTVPPYGGNGGAGGQLASIALLKITGFGSGSLSQIPVGTGGIVPASGLNFANTGTGTATNTNGDSPYLGGEFSNTHCIKDVPVAETGPDPGPSGNVATMDGVYVRSGDLKLKPGQVGKGKNITIFVTGDLYIEDTPPGQPGITYQNWGTLSEIPSFVVKVKGNIYIHPNVRQLDGLYIAEDPSGAKGKIYTCGTDTAGAPPYVPVTSGAMYNTCYKQLTVFGAFVANKINMMRTFGSLRNGSGVFDSTTPSGCSNDRGGTISYAGLPASCAAEVFRFSPEMMLSNQPITPPDNGATHFDYITSLPPVL